MDIRIKTGKLGEDLAVDFLFKNKFKVLHRNWRYGKKEVDIIAQKEMSLHFIEIKTRKTARFGNPEENVTTHKLTNMLSVASHYLASYPSPLRIQFDVLAIVLEPEINYFFIEDVYL